MGRFNGLLSAKNGDYYIILSSANVKKGDYYIILSNVKWGDSVNF